MTGWGNLTFLLGVRTGVAWLSSVCAVRRSLKWGNKRNPHCLLQVSDKTAAHNAEEGEDDAKSAWPFDALGDTRATMVSTMGCQAVRRS